MPELEICTTCFDLRGELDGWMNPCRCDLAAWEARGERHPRFGDLVRNVQMCQCCTLAVLRSGSRWSVWFCANCLPHVTERNEAAGLCVVPIGRHSMMNRVELAGDTDPDSVELDVFVDAARGLFDRIDRLDTWARRRTHDLLDRLGLLGPPGVPVTTYLAAARAAGLTKQGAIDELWAEFASIRE
jgi:hypothetical protein